MFLNKQEINTGRQREFDYLKGLFIPMIILVHAFQLMGGTAEPFYEVFYPLCTLTGSTIFLFVMGLGSTYSRSSEKQMVLMGVKLILWQVAWNVLALAIPFLLGQGIRALCGLSMEIWPIAWAQTGILLQYINIFFIAGVSYLLLALLKKLRLPTWGYLVLAIALLIATPFLYITDFTTGVPAIDYILTMFCGGRDSVSLIFLPHFVYVLFGVWFGRILRRTADKKALYLRILPGAFIIGMAYVVYAIATTDSLTNFCNLVSYDYIFPGIFRMLANLSWTLIVAAFLYAAAGKIQKLPRLDKVLVHFNRKTSAYYAVHPFLYSLVTSIAAMAPMGWLACIAAAVADTFLSWFVIRIWDKIYK